MHIPFQSADQVHADLAGSQSSSPNSPWLLCVADCHAEALPTLLDLLRERGMRVCGGVFPGLIHGDARLDHGLLAIPLPAQSHIGMARLGGTAVDWLQPPPSLPEDGTASSLILVDCQAPGIAMFLEEIYDRYASRIPHLGAGAGYHDLRAAPSVFTEDGFVPHSGLVVLMPRRATVNVRHGWRRVRGPFVATRTHGNVIQELNWEPAGSFYRAQVEALAPQLQGRPVFPDLASSYPLCIGREGGEDVMRDPMYISDADELVVLSDVPENSVMYLANGDLDSLLESAHQVVEDCGAPEAVASCFVSDCYSRALMLGDSFPRELAVMTAALARVTDVPAEGVLALGEIAANGRRNLEFFNKTIVVALSHRSAP